MKISKVGSEARLNKIKGRAYAKTFATFLKSDFGSDGTMPFIALISHKYPDLDEKKSKMLPFLLFGNQGNFWTNYHKGDNKKNKEKMLAGTMTREGNVFRVTIEKTRSASLTATSTKKSLQFMTALFQRVNKEFRLEFKGAVQDKKKSESKGQNPEMPVSGTGGNSNTPNREEQIIEYKTIAQSNANELSRAVNKINRMLANQSIKRIKDKIKNKQPITQKHLNELTACLTDLREGRKVHEEAKPQIQKLFTIFNKTKAKEKELEKLILLARKLMVSKSDALAQKMADAYYYHKKKRRAKPQEIKAFKPILDTKILPVIKENKLKQSVGLQIAFVVLKKTGRRRFSKRIYSEVVANYQSNAA